MTASHLKVFGESIAKGLGEKTLRRLGVGGKALGRTGAVVGIGFLAYELYKNYRENIENEPAYQETMSLQAELDKWTGAISCIGREPYQDKEFGSFHEGGAINALYRKKAFKGRGVKDADPKEAYTLIGRAMNYIRQTENLLQTDKFEEKKSALVSRLRKLQLQISAIDDYRPIQNKLAQIVDDIRPIAALYSSRIYDCSREIQKTLGSNAAWAAISMATLGLLRKPPK
ncbi:MAG: hypothetical protein JSW26_12405 [Desulfobacterales bacterium]|nr:MAG: hypothetical protein JSW26_12405 [Desulfobacterales bacterium]